MTSFIKIRIPDGRSVSRGPISVTLLRGDGYADATLRLSGDAFSFQLRGHEAVRMSLTEAGNALRRTFVTTPTNLDGIGEDSLTAFARFVDARIGRIGTGSVPQPLG